MEDSNIKNFINSVIEVFEKIFEKYGYNSISNVLKVYKKFLKFW